jgi:hypothetical protein
LLAASLPPAELDELLQPVTTSDATSARERIMSGS